MSETVFYNSKNLVGIGSVGIGTTSLTCALTVISNIVHVSNGVGVGGFCGGIALGSCNNGPGLGHWYVSTNAVNRDGGSGPYYDYGNQGDLVFNRHGGNLATAGMVEAMRLSGTSGYLGIGTPTPGAPLTVASGSSQYPLGVQVLESTHTTSRRASVLLGQDTTSWTVGQDSEGNGTRNFFIYGGTVQNVKISMSPNGNVGIGTTNPQAPLHVFSNVGMSLSNTTSVNYQQTSILGFNFGGGDGFGTRDSFRLVGVTVNRDGGAGPTYYDYGAQSDLVFQRKTNNSYGGNPNDKTFTEVMRISGANGNVGIGTQSPGSPLTVQCADGYQSGITLGTNAGNASGPGEFMIQRGPSALFSGFNGSNCMIFHTANEGVATTGPVGCVWMSSGSRLGMFYDTRNSRLGIGTTTPTASLHVTGNVYASDTISSANPMMFRNRLYNGNMGIWQRATASTSTAAGVYTTADRWCGALSTSGLFLTRSATTVAPFQYSLQFSTFVTTGVALIEQRIEAANVGDLVNGTKITVSFYASQIAGTPLVPLVVGLYYPTSTVDTFTDTTVAVAADINTPTLTATLTYYTLTFTLSSASVATNGLCLRFKVGATTTAPTFLITGVQLEKGFTASPYEFRPYATELALCQRYYTQLNAGSVFARFGTAYSVSTTSSNVFIPLPVTLRTRPTLTMTVANFRVEEGSSQQAVTSVTPTSGSAITDWQLNGVGLTVGHAAVTANLPGTLQANNTTSAFIGFSAEL